MYTDPRGGGNRKKFNQDFFKTWSYPMAYVLGFISADGTVIDARNSSRTCYTSITSVDKSIIMQIRKVLGSYHQIYRKVPRLQKFKSNTYLCAEAFVLKIGSKTMFQDLVNLGIIPKKSLRLNLPKMIPDFFRFFLRGYFDGDGCVHVSIPKGRKKPEIIVVFTCGCKKFLENLSRQICQNINASVVKVSFGSGAFRLRYRKADSLKILSFMYNDLTASPFLQRKYQIYQNYLKTLN